MKVTILLFAVVLTVVIFSISPSQPSYNGADPGCGGSSCHTFQTGIVTAEVINDNQVRITVSGTTSNVAGELVNGSNQVVAVNEKTSSNPFILAAPGAGTYTVNAGFKSPSRQWSSASVVVSLTGIDDKLIGVNPASFELYSNYPNPFNPTTKIRYSIPQSGFTTLKIFNITGEEVKTLVNSEKAAGVYEVNFTAEGLSSGTYFYELKSGTNNVIKKMVLLK